MLSLKLKQNLSLVCKVDIVESMLGWVRGHSGSLPTPFRPPPV